jgi:hypothetical protein
MLCREQAENRRVVVDAGDIHLCEECIDTFAAFVAELRVERGDVSMANPDTIDRLRWHAGLDDLDDTSVPSVASVTYPDGRTPGLERAVADFIASLERLNHELNGACPSDATAASDSISRKAAYAVAEVVRMLDGHGDAERERWLVETAWLAVLAGDIDDLQAHVAEEAAHQPPA